MKRDPTWHRNEDPMTGIGEIGAAEAVAGMTGETVVAARAMIGDAVAEAPDLIPGLGTAGGVTIETKYN